MPASPLRLLCLASAAFVGDPCAAAAAAPPAEPKAAAESAAPPPTRLDPDAVRARLLTSGELRLAGRDVLIRRQDFVHEGAEVEAVLVRPAGEAPVPGIVLVPGFSRTAYDMLPVALRFAQAGFATLAVSQPGFGGSAGPADFAGPRTFAALEAAARRFADDPQVERERLGIYGYSRGALAAAQLAARTDLFGAAVLGGGIYDFAAAYRQVRLEGIRRNMAAEGGLDEEAVRFRSPIRDVEGLDGPVLIIHGADDVNAPPDQARALAERLRAAGREHELIVIPDRGHALAVADIVLPAIAFFRRHLAPSGSAPPS